MDDRSQPLPPLHDRFGYLLKHARVRLGLLSAASLEHYGVNGRELAVLTVLAEGEPPSQLEAAGRLSIDRTTMVGLIDDLEGKGLVERRPDTTDRRRNTVVLTPAGRETLAGASRATDEAEAAFLAPLRLDERAQLRSILQRLVAEDDTTRS